MSAKLILSLLLGLILAGCCMLHSPAPITPTPPEPERSTFTLPLSAQNSDLFCVETTTIPFRLCRPVGELRLYMITLRANPEANR